MTDYINKVDLLLALADLPNEAGKREALRVVYDMPTRMLYTVDDMNRQWEQDMEVGNGGDPWVLEDAFDAIAGDLKKWSEEMVWSIVNGKQ